MDEDFDDFVIPDSPEGFDEDNGASSSSDSNASDNDFTCGMDWRVIDLHPHSCVQSRDDFRRMQRKLIGDPYALNRAQESESQELPLHVAIYCQHLHCVNFLLDEGADVDRQNFQGSRPLEKAVEAACVASVYIDSLKAKKIIEMLLKHGANINYEGQDHEGTYFLSQILTKMEDQEMLQLFLEYGADTEDWEAIRGGVLYYETPLYIAMTHGDFASSKLLFLYGAEVDLHRCFPEAQYYLSNLQPITHALVDAYNEIDSIRMLHLYHQFGGSFHLRYRGLTTLQLLARQMKRSNDEKLNNFKKVYEELSSNPLSLLSLSRLAVRRCFGRELRANLKELPIPRSLRKMLKFKTD